mmetsp:Transcript_55145/g.118427  ORF Transcript_55145/g.118427 Transcript_55145/m.118427 type:complete len:203 (+) Transcript_55145:2590-3198(+)
MRHLDLLQLRGGGRIAGRVVGECVTQLGDLRDVLLLLILQLADCLMTLQLCLLHLLCDLLELHAPGHLRRSHCLHLDAFRLHASNGGAQFRDLHDVLLLHLLHVVDDRLQLDVALRMCRGLLLELSGAGGPCLTALGERIAQASDLCQVVLLRRLHVGDHGFEGGNAGRLRLATLLQLDEALDIGTTARLHLRHLFGLQYAA